MRQGMCDFQEGFFPPEEELKQPIRCLLQISRRWAILEYQLSKGVQMLDGTGGIRLSPDGSRGQAIKL